MTHLSPLSRCILESLLPQPYLHPNEYSTFQIPRDSWASAAKPEAQIQDDIIGMWFLAARTHHPDLQEAPPPNLSPVVQGGTYFTRLRQWVDT